MRKESFLDPNLLFIVKFNIISLKSVFQVSTGGAPYEGALQDCTGKDAWPQLRTMTFRAYHFGDALSGA
jgi:hypothetical protein